MEARDLLEKIAEADMVLVGLGEDFNCKKILSADAAYSNGCEILKQTEYGWLIPAWNEYCLERNGSREASDALEKLRILLKDKNYFLVSVSTNSEIAKLPWKHDRVVMPCGSVLKKQCTGACGEPVDVTEGDTALLQGAFTDLYQKGHWADDICPLGKCPKCGKEFVFNNIYAPEYQESGYLPRWKLYMKWLQGTLNRKLLVLELGVGMEFPSVIRWPFEKVAFFNQKAHFYRIHERLYQLTPELAEKGCGISSNAIDWLRML